MKDRNGEKVEEGKEVRKREREREILYQALGIRAGITSSHSSAQLEHPRKMQTDYHTHV